MEMFAYWFVTWVVGVATLGLPILTALDRKNYR